MRLEDILSKKELCANELKKIKNDVFKLECQFEQRKRKIEQKKLKASINMDKLNRVLVNGVTFAPNKITDIIAYMLLKFNGEEWQKKLTEHYDVYECKEMQYLSLVFDEFELPISKTPKLSDENGLNTRNMTYYFLKDDLNISIPFSDYSKYSSTDVTFINYGDFKIWWPIRACIDELARKQIENEGKELSYDEMVACVDEYSKNNSYINGYIKTRKRISF